MLIDLHAHSAGISTCCLIPYNEVIDTAIEHGIDGAVLTNHYSRKFMKECSPEEFAKRYIEEYRAAKEYADSVGFKLFFGAEVTMKLHKNAHVLLYGIDEDFVLAHPTMHMYTHSELYRLVKEAGGAFVQAHPLRKEDKLLDVSMLDGIELSCHPLYEGTRADVLLDIAKEAGIILTCGGDYHADTYRPHCGIYLDEGIKDEKALSDFLCTTDRVTLCIHEVGTETPYDLTYERKAQQKRTV
ncbi:MAG: PHP domain-containing protein [Ruminococcaceae bacterium]|nr:PHP domain-containing protein [Oscillospiraceae bacterium]